MIKDEMVQPLEETLGTPDEDQTQAQSALPLVGELSNFDLVSNQHIKHKEALQERLDEIGGNVLLEKEKKKHEFEKIRPTSY